MTIPLSRATDPLQFSHVILFRFGFLGKLPPKSVVESSEISISLDLEKNFITGEGKGNRQKNIRKIHVTEPITRSDIILKVNCVYIFTGSDINHYIRN